MNEQTKFDMIIVGGGPGGYTAALYGARAGLSTLVLEKMAPGGQMTLTGAIDNYPGFPEGIDGFELGERMRQGAQRFGAQTRMTEVLALDLAPDVKRVETDQGTYFARTVVLATGAAPKRLGVPGEEELIGRGVSYCAHCDGMFYRGKTVAVVGGGNTAVAEALHLARICEKVILIHRRDQLRATKIYHRQLEAAPNVEIRWNSAVEALNQTDGALTGWRCGIQSPGHNPHCPATACLSAWARTRPRHWSGGRWPWMNGAMWWRTKPPAPISPVFLPWGICGPGRCARSSPRPRMAPPPPISPRNI